MNEYILVCVAWPYANADIHQGNVTGSYLPADIYARFHRLRGNHVLMVSGSDSHGTPVTVRAEEEGKTAREVFEHFHHRFLDLFQQMGLSYDLFTHTDTENHHQVSQDVFTSLLNNGYMYQQITQQMYSPSTKRFLPDRYVEGKCPNCGYERARGDQCDNCNKLFESAAELINPHSKLDHSALELRTTEHYFIEQGLIGRAVTRDMDWGIAVPVDGYDGKVLYVWFEAVIGYLSASVEWAKNNGTPDAWRNWWQNDAARASYFIGKDNIPFHAVMWPAQLLGTRGLYNDDMEQHLNLPYDVPANEFMNMEGRKISGSMNWGVWMLDALERHDPDPLRYYLTAVMPETRDSDWSWQGYLDRNNSELVGNWGNLVNRVLNMTNRYFKGAVPDPGELTSQDTDLLAAIDAGFDTVAQLYDACKFRAVVQENLRLSTLVNTYLEETKPWTAAKTDMTATARSLYTSIQAINALKLFWAPILPYTSQRLHDLLGYEGTLFGDQVVETYTEATRSHIGLTYKNGLERNIWQRTDIPIGHQLPKPQPLFKKLDPSIVADELARLGQ